ncbi:HIT family protein [Methanobacterium alcaliphilum]|uniref:HIT family protein n=1 Tax=Methanobacterium alcaliphilum TaxID=392018 RepID=UPI00200B5F10|nr:HIT family protein [Methanobacterium alcaliphilum]MCK9150342.1 HIT family protein [Methanobacterium alcaliphilum]
MFQELDLIICEYCAIEGYYGTQIYEFDKWILYLAPSQRYFGTCVLALKRQCRDLMDLNQSEWLEFGEIVKLLEESLTSLFQPDLFNWSCFKNSAFRSDNPEPEIHWHLMPRYKNPVTFNGTIFEDPDFGYIPQPITKTIPAELMEMLKKSLESVIQQKQI